MFISPLLESLQSPNLDKRHTSLRICHGALIRKCCWCHFHLVTWPWQIHISQILEGLRSPNLDQTQISWEGFQSTRKNTHISIFREVKGTYLCRQQGRSSKESFPLLDGYTILSNIQNTKGQMQVPCKYYWDKTQYSIQFFIDIKSVVLVFERVLTGDERHKKLKIFFYLISPFRNMLIYLI